MRYILPLAGDNRGDFFGSLTTMKCVVSPCRVDIVTLRSQTGGFAGTLSRLRAATVENHRGIGHFVALLRPEMHSLALPESALQVVKELLNLG